MVRAVFEGVAYSLRWLLEAVEDFIGGKIEFINMIGGGARSDLWCQMHADILNREIRQVADAVQANVRGVALLAGVSEWLLQVQRYFKPGGNCQDLHP